MKIRIYWKEVNTYDDISRTKYKEHKDVADLISYVIVTCPNCNEEYTFNGYREKFHCTRCNRRLL